jgi:sporadic carbohydrate cluster 2OG-Fe(II) oxygenase
MSLLELESHFCKHGWMVVKFANPEPIYEARNALIKELRKITGDEKITLEQYHEIVADDGWHTELQIQLTKFFRDSRFGSKVIAAQKDFFKALLGPDLNVQSNPYLRITRPHKPQDNIGYHRDTFYGGSPFELSVLVPYVEVTLESALSVLSGSHIRPESDFPTTQIRSQEVTKGSPKHQLGFLYAPKLIDSACTVNMQPVPLKLGEALIFSLSTVHGSVENCGRTSRWSSDIRVMNALAPVDLSMRPHYYEFLSYSVVTEQANNYFAAQSAPLIQA